MNVGDAIIDTKIRHLIVKGFVQVTFHLQLIKAKRISSYIYGLMLLFVLPE